MFLIPEIFKCIQRNIFILVFLTYFFIYLPTINAEILLIFFYTQKPRNKLEHFY